jgi:signal peptidase I
VIPVVAAVLAAACIIGCGLAVVRRRYLVVTVCGSSMRPTYDDADRVVVRRTPTARPAAPRPGEIVVLRPPLPELAIISPLLVKRVAAVPGDNVPPDFRPAVPLPVVPPGRLLVRGDNDGSADSRSFGLVDAGLVVGTVVRSGRPGPARSRRARR